MHYGNNNSYLKTLLLIIYFFLALGVVYFLFFNKGLSLLMLFFLSPFLYLFDRLYSRQIHKLSTFASLVCWWTLAFYSAILYYSWPSLEILSTLKQSIIQYQCSGNSIYHFLIFHVYEGAFMIFSVLFI